MVCDGGAATHRRKHACVTITLCADDGGHPPDSPLGAADVDDEVAKRSTRGARHSSGRAMSGSRARGVLADVARSLSRASPASRRVDDAAFAARRASRSAELGTRRALRVGPRVSLVRAILRRVAQGGRRRRERLRRVGVRLFGDAVRSRRASFSPPPPVHLGRVSKPGVPPRGPRVRRLLAGHPPRDRLRRRRLPRAPPRRALRRRHPPPRPRPRRRPARTPRGVRATSLLPNRSRRARSPPSPNRTSPCTTSSASRTTSRASTPRSASHRTSWTPSRRRWSVASRSTREPPRTPPTPSRRRRVRSFAVAGETGRRVPEKVRRDHRLAPERTGDEVRDHRLEVFHFEVLVLEVLHFEVLHFDEVHFEVLVLHDDGGGGGASAHVRLADNILANAVAGDDASRGTRWTRRRLTCADGIDRGGDARSRVSRRLTRRKPDRERRSVMAPRELKKGRVRGGVGARRGPIPRCVRGGRRRRRVGETRVRTGSRSTPRAGARGDARPSPRGGGDDQRRRERNGTTKTTKPKTRGGREGRDRGEGREGRGAISREGVRGGFVRGVVRRRRRILRVFILGAFGRFPFVVAIDRRLALARGRRRGRRHGVL